MPADTTFTATLKIAISQGAYPRDLAKEFECAVTTIERWASGDVRPHPKVQAFVMKRLAK